LSWNNLFNLFFIDLFDVDLGEVVLDVVTERDQTDSLCDSERWLSVIVLEEDF